MMFIHKEKQLKIPFYQECNPTQFTNKHLIYLQIIKTQSKIRLCKQTLSSNVCGSNQILKSKAAHLISTWHYVSSRD